MEGDGRYQGDQCQLRLPNFRSEDLMDKVSAQPSLSIKGVMDGQGKKNSQNF